MLISRDFNIKTWLHLPCLLVQQLQVEIVSFLIIYYLCYNLMTAECIHSRLVAVTVMCMETHSNLIALSFDTRNTVSRCFVWFLLGQ